jgi:alkylated DNA nucleotide flippase Atl1
VNSLPKSWCEKLYEVKDVPKVETIPPKMEKSWGKGTFVIPAPIEVDELMRNVPAGKVTTVNDIRAALANKHGTTIACPITTGIFARIAAGAAEERKLKGEKDSTPYWRTLKVGGVINEKYPGGVEAQAKLLEKEGHTVVQKGKTCRVKNYEKALAKL